MTPKSLLALVSILRRASFGRGRISIPGGELGIGAGLTHRSDLFDRFAGRPHLTLKAVEIVADGHGEGQQFFQRLLRLVEGYGDAAWLQPESLGEVLELLLPDLSRGRDQKLRPFQAVFLQLRQGRGDLAPALPLIEAGIWAMRASRSARPLAPTRTVMQGAMICCARRRPTPSRNSTAARSTKGRRD